MAVTMNAATFMGKNFSTIQSFVNSEDLTLKQMFDVTAQLVNNQDEIVNTSDLTLKKMFDISAKLVSEQDEIFKVGTIPWEKHSWKYLSLIGDEAIINLQRAKVYVFSDSVLLMKATETMMGSVESRPNSSGTFSQDSPRCSFMV